MTLKRTVKLLGPEVGKSLRRLRNEKGITQEQLARLVGVSRGYIAIVEKGVVKADNPVLYDIFKFLGFAR